MSPVIAFLLGLLAGGVLEQLIDRLARRPHPQRQPTSEPPGGPGEAGSLPSAVPITGVAPDRIAMQPETPLAERPPEKPAASQPPPPDALEVIHGIGPVIARRLNQAGIFTFEQLAAQTPEGLRALLGASLQRLTDEESLIAQARELAQQRRG